MVRVLGNTVCACKSVGENTTERAKIIAERKAVKEGAVAGFDCVCTSKRASGKRTISFADSIQLREEGIGKFKI